jgi:hypothetical protein
MHCFVVEWPDSYWLGVESHAGELLISETITDIASLLARADAIRASFVAGGWRDNDSWGGGMRVPRRAR